MGLSQIDVVVVIAYAIGIFGLAQWVSGEKPGHAKDTSDYFLASKSLPWWAIGVARWCCPMCSRSPCPTSPS